MIGTNNTGQRKDPAEQTAEGVKKIIDILRKQLPDTKILLLGVFPRSSKATDKPRVTNREINDIISTYADNKNIYYLNINEKFLDADGVLPRDIMPDLLHPNAKGYQIWAEAIEPMVKKALVCHKPERIPEFLDLAYRTAMSGRPGPVYLEYPVDVLNAFVEADRGQCHRPGDVQHDGRGDAHRDERHPRPEAQ